MMVHHSGVEPNCHCIPAVSNRMTDSIAATSFAGLMPVDLQEDLSASVQAAFVGEDCHPDEQKKWYLQRDGVQAAFTKGT